MPDTYLSQAVDATMDVQAAYDTNVKYLLADKQVLARILKYAVSEFREMELQVIIECISDQIEIGSKPVDPGLSNFGRVRACLKNYSCDLHSPLCGEFIPNLVKIARYTS